MDNFNINQHLIRGEFETEGVLPHVDQLDSIPFVFHHSFGLESLPEEPGVLLIRGPRQYGKSTWLEQQIALTIKQFGAGSALYLNGDEIQDSRQLLEQIRALSQLFAKEVPVKRLFIDEITAIKEWENAIKRLIDGGELKHVLLVTTGSKARDLRRGFEKLPGRKGKLTRTSYLFTPLSYAAFKDKCEGIFKEETLYAYLLSGGSPVGANALAETGRLPEYVTSIINDWVYGEFAASGHSRAHLLAVLSSLFRTGGTPVGQAKLARESGLSNNTVVQSYIELLSDLMTVIPAYPIDLDREIALFRKPCKYHFINLLMAISWHPKKPRTIEELKNLGPDLGMIFEWAVAQELWRRLCIESTEELPDHFYFWQSKEHEIDFVLPSKKLFLEVKAGKCSQMEFAWFLKSFKNKQLTVVNKNRFETEKIKGVTLEEFLLGAY